MPAPRSTLAVLLALALSACQPASVATEPAGATGRPASSPVAPASPSVEPGPPRSGSGIPLEIDGQPVTFGLSAIAMVQASTDATPFLVGAWLRDGFQETCTTPPVRPPELLSGCRTFTGGDSPWLLSLSAGRLYWGPRDGPSPSLPVSPSPVAGPNLPGGTGPAVVRVHTHDPGAAACPAARRPACLLVMVVEEVLWSGDNATTVGPVSALEAVQRLADARIREAVSLPDGSKHDVARALIGTAVAGGCAAPWPRQVYQLRGDSRFGLIALFPTEAERVGAQAALDPTGSLCGLDPRIVRPGAGQWIGSANILVLVFATDVAEQLPAVLAGAVAPLPDLPLPGPSLDESYRLVDDAQALRLAGDVESWPLSPDRRGDCLYGAVPVSAAARLAANALTYTIADGVPVTAADVPAATWATLGRCGLRDTARLFVVTHPDTTDPALAEERVIAFVERFPSFDPWGLLLVP